MKPAALFLDLDGTLIESETLQARSLDRFLKTRMLALSSTELDYVIGRAWQDIHRGLDLERRAGVNLDELCAGCWQARLELESQGESITVLDGAREMVQRIHALQIPMAIVSGSGRIEIEAALSALKIAPFLEFYLGAEDYAAGKPDPAGYLLAAERLCVEPKHCVVLEDSEAGIASGRAAKMAVIATSAGLLGGSRPGAADHRAAHLRIDRLDDVRGDLLEEALRRNGVDDAGAH